MNHFPGLVKLGMIDIKTIVNYGNDYVYTLRYCVSKVCLYMGIYLNAIDSCGFQVPLAGMNGFYSSFPYQLGMTEFNFLVIKYGCCKFKDLQAGIFRSSCEISILSVIRLLLAYQMIFRKYLFTGIRFDRIEKLNKDILR